MDATSSLGLIERARNGDDAAIQRLFDKYSRRLAVHIHYRLGVQMRRYADVDDVFQMTCLEAVRDIARFEYREPGSFMHWLMTIAEYVIADLARHEGRQKRRADALLRFRSAGNPAGPEPADSQTPSRIFAENEGLRELLVQLDGLPDEYRGVILMAKVEGLSTEQIAARMGRTRPATALLLHRAIKRLRMLRDG